MIFSKKSSAFRSGEELSASGKKYLSEEFSGEETSGEETSGEELYEQRIIGTKNIPAKKRTPH
jgi:hypothetical protein